MAFPYHDWRKGQSESFRTRDGHLLIEFEHHPLVEQVLVVDRPVSRAERIVRSTGPYVSGLTIAERHHHGRRARLTRVGPKTIVLDIAHPDILAPLLRRRGWWFDVFDDGLTQDLIRWAVDITASHNPAAIAWVPTVLGALTAIHPSTVVFDSLDNWITHPILRANRVEAIRGYRRLRALAAHVFVPAEASREQLLPFSEGIEVLPNGVDVDAFRAPAPRPPDLPPGPVVGYVGKLGVRLDGPFIRDVASKMPEVSFVFVGPVLERRALSDFRRLPNVILIGDRPYTSVPAYLAAFDIAWIPHRVGEGETGGDLIKRYEYWAAGRQVVSTPVQGTDTWADQLHVARDAQGAILTIRGLLDGTISTQPTNIPADRTWTVIADRLVRALYGDRAQAPQ